MRHRAASICGVRGCLHTRPCPDHKPKAWARTKPAPKRATGAAYYAQRAAVCRAAHGRCQLCAMPGQVADHIIPLAEGGPDELGNMQWLCHACHNTKTRGEARRGRERALRRG